MSCASHRSSLHATVLHPHRLLHHPTFWGQLPTHSFLPLTLFSQLKTPSGILMPPFSNNNWDLCALSSGHLMSPYYFSLFYHPSPEGTSPLLTCLPPLEAVCSIFRLRAVLFLPGAISDQPEAVLLPSLQTFMLVPASVSHAVRVESGWRKWHSWALLWCSSPFYNDYIHFTLWAFSSVFKLCPQCGF